MSESLRQILDQGASAGAGITFVLPERGARVHRTWTELLANGARRATQLAQRGVVPGDRVVLIDSTGAALVETIAAVVHLGAIPILLAAPPRSGESRSRLIESVVAETEARLLCAGAELVAKDSAALAPFEGRVHPIAAATPLDLAPAPHGPEHDTAFIQFSSGSTRHPRGVVVPQRCLVANLRAIGGEASIAPGEVMVSWLPLHHDMGLVAGLFGPPAWGGQGVMMDPLTFAHRPSRWLRAIAELGGNISVAPNFAYELCLRLIRPTELEGLRLDGWRLSWNGAEMVLPSTIRRFEAHFAPWGVRPNLIVSCYGAAEATLKISSAYPGTAINVFSLSKAGLGRGVVEEAASPADTLEVVSAGALMGGTTATIRDPLGAVLGERAIGEIEIEGPSVCPGYYGAPDPSLAGGRFRTGDLGFVSGGEIFITGRAKDLIIVAGRNLYPHDLESAAIDAGGGRVRRAAAFGLPDPASGTERVVVMVEVAGKSGLTPELHARLAPAIADAAGLTAVTVVGVDQLPVTSSGKVQRSRAKELFALRDKGPETRS